MSRINFLLAVSVFLLSAVFASAQTVTVSGYMTDITTGETLLGATVVCEEKGAVTNSYGFYSISLPARDVRLTYSYLGYDQVEMNLSLRRDTTLNVGMVPGEVLTGATVSAAEGVRPVRMGAIELPKSFIENTPVPLGEQDVLKTVQLLPGVQSGMEGTSGLLIRGGNVDENLYLLDGTPLYNVSHMLGLFSAFTPDAIKKVTVYRGSFPARFGGRVSGIIDVRTNDGNLYETKGSVSVGLLTDRVHVEGPIIKDKLAYSVSGRAVHTLLFAPIIKLAGSSMNYFFYDFSGKLSYYAGSRDKFFLTAYAGDDDFHSDTWLAAKKDIEGETVEYRELQNSSMKWGNIVTSLKWNHIFSGKLFAEASIAFSRYRYNTQLSSRDSEDRFYSYYGNLSSGIYDVSGNYNLDWTVSDAHRINAGISLIHHDFRPSSRFHSTGSFDGETGDFSSDNTNRIEGWENAIYVEDAIKVADWLRMEVGLRGTLITAENTTYSVLEPRLSASFDTGRGLLFQLSGGRASQYAHLLTSSALSMPSDLWIPVTDEVKPVISDQASAAVIYEGLEGWNFSLETYYKISRNVVEYRDGMSFFGTRDGWETLVSSGMARSRGVELYARKDKGKATGWLSYTLAWSDRIFPDGDVNQGRWFPYKYDRRHNLAICVNYKFNGKWDLSAVWKYQSGSLTTIADNILIYPVGDAMSFSKLPNGDGRINDTGLYYSGRNNYRLPASHCLNLSLNMHKMKKRGEAIWSFGLYNAYNSLNPDIVYMMTEQPDYSSHVYDLKLKKVTVLPILPSVNYTFKF